MISKIKYPLWFLYSFLFLLYFNYNSVVYAQGQNGKLTGKVLDAATKEPLIGVNVILVNTNIGAATDLDGRFIILNIPPGNYDVTASLVGYSKVVTKDVGVYIDRTTEVNFELSDQMVEIDQVVIIANKAPIIKDRTSTSTTIDNKQIEAAPLEGLRGALDLSAGFQKNETGDYSVRGSTSYEVNFQINGVVQSTSNTSAPGTFGTQKADNSWKFDVNPLGVQQLQLITGGFSAEYGNAQAGVVKVVLKEGGPKFTGDFRVEYRPSGQYHYGDYIYDKNNYEWQKWGTVDKWFEKRSLVESKFSAYLSKYDDIKQTDPEAYKQIVDNLIVWAHDVWVKNHEPADDNPLGIYDYRQYSYQRYLFAFGGPLGRDPNLLKFYISGEYKKNPTRLPTPERNQISQNYILNLTFQPAQKHKIKFMGSYQSYVGGIWSGSTDIRWSGLAFSPPGVSTKYIIDVDPVRNEQTIAQSIDWVYTIDNNSFLNLLVSHQQEKYELPFKYLPGYNMEMDRLDNPEDSVGAILREGEWWEETYFRAPIGFSTNYYQDNRTENFSLSLDYTNQILSTNLLKLGLKFYYWDMINNGVNSSFQANSFVARNGFAEYYKAYPYNFAFYLQDKMEYEGMIANLGLRAEVYNFQTQVAVDPYNVLYTGTDGPGALGNPETRDSKTQFILLPRLGISFPIGESTAFRLQYGHFASMPIFSQALSVRTARGISGLGNPDLEPKVTVNYEFGLQQVLGANNRLDIAIYYNDRTTQIGNQQIASYTGSANNFAGFSADNRSLYLYNTYSNNSFGSTVGLEIIFETITIENWSYRLSYSLSQTTAGNYGAQIIYPDDTRGFSARNYTGEFLASWDRTHNFRGLIQYFFKDNEGPEFLGVKPLENTIVSLTYTAQSGTPFTYVTEFDQIQDVVFNRRYPIETSVDLNISKDIFFSDVKLFLALRVMNLFDNKWLTPMSQFEDTRLWIEEGVTIDQPGNDPLRLGYVVAPYRVYRNIPRQVFFTVGIGF